MTVTFKNEHGRVRRVSLENDVTILIGQDGTAITSLANAYQNERLLTPEQTEVAINELQ